MSEVDPFLKLGPIKRSTPKPPSREMALRINANMLSAAAQGLKSVPVVAEVVPEKRQVNTGPAFTTKAGISWRKSQGWTLRHSEQSVAYKKNGVWRRRTQDLALALDAEYIFEGRIISEQYGGVKEESDHFQKFIGQGGFEKARRLGISQVNYVAFRRGEKTPVFVHEWRESVLPGGEQLGLGL